MRSGNGVVHAPRPSRLTAYAAGRFGAPVINAEDLHHVLERYGLEAQDAARNLRLGRRSRNVAVTTDQGKKVVKLYRPQWNEDTVRYAHSILTRLDESAFPTPPLVRTSDGADWVGAEAGIFAVFDFIPGKNYSLSFLPRGDRLRLTATAGRTLARLHHRLERFTPQGRHHLGFETHAGKRRRDLSWYNGQVEDLKDASGQITGEAEMKLADRLVGHENQLLSNIALLDAELADADFPRLVIHGDYGLHNLLFEASDRAIPIDYELARLDWRINDLISAVGKYRYTGGVYDLESMETFLWAYTNEFPLTQDERRLLPTAWRLSKLQAAVQYWNSYFETKGPVRKLESALDSISQAQWVEAHPDALARLIRAASASDNLSPTSSSTATDGDAALSLAQGPVVMEVTPNLEIGGAQETARTLAKYLPRVGCPTIVATFGDGPLKDELERSGVIVERLPARRHSVMAGPLFVGEMIARRRDLRRLVDRYDVDVIQTQGLGTLDFLVMTLARGDRVKVWWTIQNANFLIRDEHLTRLKWLLRPKRAAHRALYRLGLRTVNGVVAVSTETERSFRESLGLNGHRIDVVCNAVDVELYPPQVARDEVRSRLGLAPSDHVMTMVGTFKRQKGHRVLIDALAGLKDGLPQLKIILVGDGERRSAITASVRTHGLEKQVHFLGSRRDIPQILAASDSFILPSLWEGLPVALVEAMASGLPVIATSVSGTNEVMEDGVTGWVVPPGVSSALKTAIVELVADPERAARMGMAGRETVEARFSARSQAESLASIFREASSSRRNT